MKKTLFGVIGVCVLGAVAYGIYDHFVRAAKMVETPMVWQVVMHELPQAAEKAAPESDLRENRTTATVKQETKKIEPEPIIEPKEETKAAPIVEVIPEIQQEPIIVQPLPAPVIVSAPSNPTPASETTPIQEPSQPTTMTENEAPSNVLPVNPATITIVSPIPAKGTGRTYVASPEIIDESNYVELGAVLKDGQGQELNMPVMTITTTDSSQNKTLQGTGNYNPRVGKYYPFHYEFHTAGKHTITFSAEGVSVSIDFDVL